MDERLDKTTVAASAPGRLSAILAPPRPVAAGAVGAASVVRLAVLAGLFVWLHWMMLHWLVLKWIDDPNWSHGFLIPLFSLFLVYSRWQELRGVRRRPWPAGLVLMLMFLVLELALLCVPGLQNFWLLGLSMVGLLFALVLYLGGPGLIRLLWVPILFLALAMPLPRSLYTRVAYPFQEFAAVGAVKVLRLANVDIQRAGSHLTLMSRSLQQRQLTVAEACSGMRLLMAFFALGVATAYLESRPVWQRVILVAAGVPIAVLCNVLRVVITSTMFYIDRPELGKDVMHNFTGMLMLIPAFAMLYGLGWLLSRLFVDAEDEDESRAEPAAAEGEGP